MHRCSKCNSPCVHGYITCSNCGGPKLNNWRDSFSDQNKRHMDFCVEYMSRFIHLSGDLHINYAMIADFVRIMDDCWRPS